MTPAGSAAAQAERHVREAEGDVLNGRVQAPAHELAAWSFDEVSLLFLCALLRRARPQHVVEFGSGVSTTTLGTVLAETSPPGVLTAVENDPLYDSSTRAAVERLGLGDTVEVVFAPLVARRVRGRMAPLYDVDLASLRARGTPGLVLVDGPPSPLGGRIGSLQQALGLAALGTIVVLDDADREGEQRALELVRNEAGDDLTVLLLEGFPKGMAVLIPHADIPLGDVGPANPATEVDG